MDADCSIESIKANFVRRCETLPLDKLEQVIEELEEVSDDHLPYLLQSLSLITERCSSKLHKRLYNIVRKVSTRPDRKAALAVLQVAPLSVCNDDVIQLVQSLEEPQVHIVVPFLPRLQKMLDCVEEGTLPFAWVECILARGLQHTNGWLRCWAVEKAIEVKREILEDHYAIILDTVLPSLSASDLLWRLLDKEELNHFCDRLTSIFKFIVSRESKRNVFIIHLLHVFSSLCCPVSLFLLSRILRLSIVSPDPFLDDSHHHLLRSCLVKVVVLSHIPMRVQAFSNLIAVFAQLYDTSEVPVTVYLPFFSSMSRLLGAPFRYSILATVAESVKAGNTLDLPPLTSILDQMRSEGTVETEEYLLALLLSDSAMDSRTIESYSDFSLNTALLFISSDDQVSSITRWFFQHPEQRQNTDMLREAVKRRTSNIDIAENIKLLLNNQDESQVLSYFIVLSLFADHLSRDTVDQLLTKYQIGTPLPDLDPSSGLNRKERVVVREEAESSRLALFLHFNNLQLPKDVQQVAEDAVYAVYEASLFSHKEQLLCLLLHLLPSLPSSDSLLPLISRILRSSEDVIQEEKKSCNFLPSVQLSLLLCMETLKRGQLLEEVTDILDRLLEASSLNISIAVVLARTLQQSIDILPDEVTHSPQILSLISQLAIFGPIPKKEVVVLNYALDVADKDNEMRRDEETRLNEACSRTRLYGIVSALHLGGRRPECLLGIVDALSALIALADKSTSKSFGLSLAHRRKTRAVALLLLLTHYDLSENLRNSLFSSCLTWLTDPSQQFSIKLAVEWIMVRLALERKEIYEQVCKLDTKMAGERIGSVSSWINMMVLLSRSVDQSLLPSLLQSILPWTTAQNFAVRCTAIAAARLIIPLLSSSSIKDLAYKVAYFDAEPAGNSQRVIGNLCGDFYFAHLHPVKDLNMETILRIIPKGTGMPKDEMIEKKIMEEVVGGRGTVVPLECTSDILLTAPSLVYNNLEKNNRCAPTIEGEDTVEADIEGESVCSSVQKKIIPKEEEKREGTSLIVVATFIDKAANLGGLCRTCEIFTVDSLVVSDKGIVSDSTFKALSMSAESWQKIDEVRPDDLLSWIMVKRNEGYTVVAAEQASDSVSLKTFQFPAKTILVMGDEKKGVPVSLLRKADHIVHIDQLGRVRSLNVHVTAALFIHQFAQQHLMMPCEEIEKCMTLKELDNHSRSLCVKCIEEEMRLIANGREMIFTDGPPTWIVAKQTEHKRIEEEAKEKKELDKRRLKKDGNDKFPKKMVMTKEEKLEELKKQAGQISDGNLQYELRKAGIEKNEAALIRLEMKREIARKAKEKEGEENIKEMKKRLTKQEIREVHARKPWQPARESCPFLDSEYRSELDKDKQKRYVAICSNFLKPDSNLRFEGNKEELKIFDSMLENERELVNESALDVLSNKPAKFSPSFFDKLNKYWHKRYELHSEVYGMNEVKRMKWREEMGEETGNRPRFERDLQSATQPTIELPDMHFKADPNFGPNPFEWDADKEKKEMIDNDESLKSLCATQCVSICMQATTAVHLMTRPKEPRCYSFFVPIKVSQSLQDGQISRLCSLDKPLPSGELSSLTLHTVASKWRVKTSYVKKREEKKGGHGRNGSSVKGKEGKEEEKKEAEERVTVEEEGGKRDTVAEEGGKRDTVAEEGGKRDTVAEEGEKRKAEEAMDNPLDCILGTMPSLLPSLPPSSSSSPSSHSYSLFSASSPSGDKIPFIVRYSPPPRSKLQISYAVNTKTELLPDYGAMTKTNEEVLWNAMKCLFKRADQSALFHMHPQSMDCLQISYYGSNTTATRQPEGFVQLLNQRTVLFHKLLEELRQLDLGEYMLYVSSESDDIVLYKPEEEGEVVLSKMKSYRISKEETYSSMSSGLDTRTVLQWQIMQSRAPCSLYPADHPFVRSLPNKGRQKRKNEGTNEDQSSSKKRRKNRKNKRSWKGTEGKGTGNGEKNTSTSEI